MENNADTIVACIHTAVYFEECKGKKMKRKLIHTYSPVSIVWGKTYYASTTSKCADGILEMVIEYITQGCGGKISPFEVEIQNIIYNVAPNEIPTQDYNLVYVQFYNYEDGTKWLLECSKVGESWECWDGTDVRHIIKLKDVRELAQVYFEPLVKQWQQKQKEHNLEMLHWFFYMCQNPKTKSLAFDLITDVIVESYLGKKVPSLFSHRVKPDWTA